MAVLKDGILGKIEGPVGNVSYYIANGQCIMRSRKNESTTPPTLAQLGVRQRIKMVHLFLKQLTEFVKIGFENVSSKPGVSGYNMAAAELMQNAIIGEYPDYRLNYSRIVLSSGPLLPAINPSVWSADGQLIFTWQQDQHWPNSEDLVMLAAHCPELDATIYKITGVKRVMGADALIPHPSWMGKKVETYISFRSENGKSVATSMYTGSMTVY